ncbi:hypothetical protein BOTBODRAFT_191874 [Botryobasidium botryosum FD-172 SS1]|uniref:Uncharacterized protein n=1 Tax=Botryobasidium botryosum (strain FD-172 SS1) TaxID=930990 RepID=A0A067LYC8_BOTB1|nr:hypothetical protein BOTBODRAFT_191874 [Botryobasidium botryosum FD-172 SS1]
MDHSALDQELYEILGGNPESPMPAAATVLLTLHHQLGWLTRLNEAKNTLQAHRGWIPLLESAWKEGSFRGIRELGELQIGPFAQSSGELQTQPPTQSFEEPQGHIQHLPRHAPFATPVQSNSANFLQKVRPVEYMWPEEARARVDGMLAPYRSMMEKYVKAEAELPQWAPQHFPSDPLLKIPTLDGENPCLLLHNLGQEVEHNPEGDLTKRVSELYRVTGTTLFINVSGSGKTRLLFEGACTNWAFYFTCHKTVDEDPGSWDLPRTIDEMLRCYGLSNKDPLRESPELEQNRQVCKHCFTHVILARLLLFSLFLQTTLGSGEKESTLHKRWLYAQVAPQALFGEDIFFSLATRLRTISLTYTNDIIRSLLEEFKSRTGARRVYVIMDEIQYSPSTPPAAYRPILRELHATWNGVADLGAFRFILSGTYIHEPTIRYAGGSGKRDGFEGYNETGGFDVREAQERYVMSYLWPGRSREQLTTEAKNLLVRLWRWLPGRFRTTARYVELVLADANPDYNLLLNKYFFATTGHWPDDPEYSHSQEPTILDMKSIKPILTEDSKNALRAHNDGQTLQNLFAYIYDYVFGAGTINKIMSYEPLLEHGLLRCQFQQGIRDCVPTFEEPIALFAATTFLQRNCDISEHIRNGIRHSTAHSCDESALEAIVKYIFLTRFGAEGGCALNDIFHFKGEEPSWSRERARLVAVSAQGDGSYAYIQVDPAGNISLYDSYNAESLDDTLAWMRNPDGVPFLRPDAYMGPSGFAMLLLENGALIPLLWQVKVLQRSDPELLPALLTLNPTLFYHIDRNWAPRSRTRQNYNSPKPPTGLIRKQIMALQGATSIEDKNMLLVLAVAAPEDESGWKDAYHAKLQGYPIAFFSRSSVDGLDYAPLLQALVQKVVNA